MTFDATALTQNSPVADLAAARDGATTFDATALTRLSRVSDLAVAPGGRWAAVVVQRLDAEETRYVSDLWRVPLPLNRMRMNQRIRAPNVRVIGTAGEQLGVIPTDEARRLAEEQGVDLVEISPRSDPPVCRLMDFEKYRKEQYAKLGVEVEAKVEPGATRLTRGPSKDTTPRFRADGALGFLSNRNPRDGAAEDGDDRRMQVWLLPADGGEAHAITDEPLGCVDFAWADDALVVLAEVLPETPHAEQRARAAELAKHGPTALHYTEGPVRHWDAWLPATSLHAIAYDARGRTDLTPTARHQLRNLPNDPGLAVHGGTVAVAWSELGADRVPDGWIQRIELATGATRALGRAPATYYATPKFSKDGHLAAERTVRRPSLGDLVRLCTFDGDTVTPIEWDAVPSLHGWTDDGALLATAPDTGRQLAYRVTHETITALTEDGSAEHLVARGSGIVGIRHRTLHPPEPFACEPGEPPRLLANLSGFTETEGAAIAQWESRTTPGDGGTPVQWFLVTPHQTKAPLLLWIHGGPVSQFADGWHWRWNPLVAAAAGYAVAMPNPRGSTGRGQAFIDGVQGNTWGAACYRDLLAVTDEAEALLGTPAAAMGGSFGGYMANWIGTQTDRFRCLVSHAGLFHLPAFYGSTDYPGAMGIEFGEHPFAGDLASFRRYSPDLHALRWKTPVLFIHGEKDYRVPITEALIAFEAVRTAGAEAELLVFPDENHWISRPRNIRAWYQAWLDFVARYLR